MAAKTAKTRALVLRKTKLSEKDLIVTLLVEDGSVLKAVAKGARRPGGSLAARMELFAVSDILYAEGKTLAVIADARLVSDGSMREGGLEQTACASPVAELVCMVAQEGLAQRRLFDMTKSALEHIRDASGSGALALCASALWKVMAQAGYRPSLASCVSCGGDVDLKAPGKLAFSLVEGGAICESCARPADAATLDRATLDWCSYLLAARFDEVAGCAAPPAALFDALQLARQWVRAHTGRNLKSLDFLFVSGLF